MYFVIGNKSNSDNCRLKKDAHMTINSEKIQKFPDLPKNLLNSFRILKLNPVSDFGE